MTGTRIAIAAIGALALVALLRGGPGDDRSDAVARLSAQVAALADELAQERRSRSLLEAEVSRLRGELDAEREAAPPAAVSAPPPRPVARPEETAEAREAPSERASELGPAAARSAALDPERLRAAGLSTSDVERYRSRVAEIELGRLYLRDQATREGWLETPRFASESRRFDEELAGLRGEFDEDLTDWMLYAEGRPNRVAVAEVLPGSAAEAAGLRPGDVLVRYDDRLVLSPSDLRDATAAGTPEAWVEVELLRGSEAVRALVPRGPLGISLETRSLEPQPAR